MTTAILAAFVWGAGKQNPTFYSGAEWGLFGCDWESEADSYQPVSTRPLVVSEKFSILRLVDGGHPPVRVGLVYTDSHVAFEIEL